MNTTTHPNRGFCGSLKGRTWLVLAGIVLVLAIGVPLYYREPPVEISDRPSRIGMGYVLRITNTGSKPLYNVLVGSPGHKKVGRATHRLDPNQSVEVGWFELPFRVEAGVYQIYANGYRGCHTYYCHWPL